jgi:cytoskeletal protein CcmA (bactofilin family)
MRFYDGSVLLIENGALQVTGTATVSGAMKVTGTMEVSGTMKVTGPLTIAGNTDVTGDFNVTGPTKLSGQVTVDGHSLFNGDVRTTGRLTVQGPTRLEGIATLTADLNVTGGGKITAGNVRMSPSASNGGLEFISGGGIGGNDGGVLMRGSSNAGILTDTLVSLFAGAHNLDVRSDGIYAPTLPKAPAGSTANLYADGSGKLFRL